MHRASTSCLVTCHHTRCVALRCAHLSSRVESLVCSLLVRAALCHVLCCRAQFKQPSLRAAPCHAASNAHTPCMSARYTAQAYADGEVMCPELGSDGLRALRKETGPCRTILNRCPYEMIKAEPWRRAKAAAMLAELTISGAVLPPAVEKPGPRWRRRSIPRWRFRASRPAGAGASLRSRLPPPTGLRLWRFGGRGASHRRRTADGKGRRERP